MGAAQMVVPAHTDRPQPMSAALAAVVAAVAAKTVMPVRAVMVGLPVAVAVAVDILPVAVAVVPAMVMLAVLPVVPGGNGYNSGSGGGGGGASLGRSDCQSRPHQYLPQYAVREFGRWWTGWQR
ncbi:MAG: hypothetical protein R3C44_09425 [Chloroflexota bacterium]